MLCEAGGQYARPLLLVGDAVIVVAGRAVAVIAVGVEDVGLVIVVDDVVRSVVALSVGVVTSSVCCRCRRSSSRSSCCCS